MTKIYAKIFEVVCALRPPTPAEIAERHTRDD